MKGRKGTPTDANVGDGPAAPEPTAMLAELDDPAKVEVVVVELDRVEERVEGEEQVVGRLADGESVVVDGRAAKGGR